MGCFLMVGQSENKMVNVVFSVLLLFREHEKEVQNRKRGKRPRGRPRKNVVS